MKFTFVLNVAAIIVLSAIIVISIIAYIEEEQVYVADNIVIGKCIIKEMTGIDCPSCGLTRSFVSISNGQWIRSLKYNFAGLLIYILLISQIINSSLFIVRKKYNRYISQFNIIFGISTCIILIVNWILKL